MEMFVADMQQQFEDLKKQMEVKNKDIENHQKEKESLTEEVFYIFLFWALYSWTTSVTIISWLHLFVYVLYLIVSGEN